MRISGLSFPEAVEQLAQRLGIAVQHEGPSRKNDDFALKDKMYEANDLAQKYFSQALKNAPPSVLEYVRNRGLSEEAILAFKIGFAPNVGNGLLQFLSSKGLSPELLLKAGLARRGQSGELYDYFRGRLMFPIHIDQRRIAGFGGRSIPALVEERLKDRTPKYLNSLETPIYEKSKILFGMPQALAGLRGTKFMYLVEGYMDVVGLWQVGIKNAVATCGTAVTEQHIRRLASIVPRVDFLFDGDDAGRRGAGKTFPLFLNSRLEAACVFLPDGEDPDSFAAKHSGQAKEQLQAVERKALFDCYIEELSAQQGGSISEMGAAAKGKVAKQAAEIVARVENPVEQAELQERLSFLLKVDSAAVSALTSNVSVKASAVVNPGPTSATQTASIRALDALPPFDKEILRSVMGLKGSIADLVLEDDLLCSLLQVETLTFLAQLSSALALARDNKAEVRRLLSQFGASWLAFWREADKLPAEDLMRVFHDVRLKSKRMRLKSELDHLAMAVRDCVEGEEKIQIAQKKLALERQLAGLEAPVR